MGWNRGGTSFGLLLATGVSFSVIGIYKYSSSTTTIPAYRQYQLPTKLLTVLCSLLFPHQPLEKSSTSVFAPIQPTTAPLHHHQHQPTAKTLFLRIHKPHPTKWSHLSSVPNDKAKNAPLIKGLEDLKLEPNSQEDEATASVYGSRFAAECLPQHEMPEHEMPKEIAYRMIRDDLSLDGNPMLNLASFVTTYMVSCSSPCFF